MAEHIIRSQVELEAILAPLSRGSCRGAFLQGCMPPEIPEVDEGPEPDWPEPEDDPLS